jgi:predicted amino acid racemase
MYLKRLLERNPALLETALDLHQSGRVPPNTWVIDLDAVAHNAQVLSAEARLLGLVTYLMTKQHARNPYVNHVAMANGVGKGVAVDIQCALQMRRYGVPVGHMGHLNQVPRRHVADALAMRPDVITIYNVEHARWIDAAAREQEVVQDLLVRPYSPDDLFFDGQQAGFPEEEISEAAEQIHSLPNVRLAGVTAFPAVRYNREAGDPVELAPNGHTAIRVAEVLRSMGFEITQINLPGNTSSSTMRLLTDAGATHVEPGHGLLGTTPSHSFSEALPELPTYTYVSEISHHFDGQAFAFGGGLFRDIYDPTFQPSALVGASFEAARENVVEYRAEIEQIIDYHAILRPGDRCRVGDTALFGFRTQMQMTRSYVAPVSGIHSGEPRLHFLFDAMTTALDKDFDPVSPDQVRKDIEQLVNEQVAAQAVAGSRD